MSSDALLDELLARPVGAVAQPRTSEPDDFTSKVEVSGSRAEVTVRVPEGTPHPEGTARTYLEEEDQDPDDWEVVTFRKVKYGPVDNPMESVTFTFRRITTEADFALSDEVIERSRALLEDFNFKELQFDASGTYVVLIADPQLGKKGTAEAVENYHNGVIDHVEAIRNLRSYGLVQAIHVAWQGDETEGVANNYANQAYTIELNQSQQLELDYELRVWALKQFLELGLPVSASSVISNHGEWTRNGSKDVVTSKGDNASTYVARQVKALFDELEPFTGRHIEWYIGDDSTPGITITLSGVECYFSHGYIEKGRGASTEIRTKAAIERQILGKTQELGAVKLWFMAHYHHFWTNEFEGRTAFGCPALEAEKSSEYMLDQFGVWSPPGMLGLLVSDEFKRGWGHLNVF